MLVAIYSAGALVYLLGYITNKRKGITLSLVFREIPPE